MAKKSLPLKKTEQPETQVQSETQEQPSDQEQIDSQFRIFDYILEMEDRIDQILTHTQGKDQEHFEKQEKELSAEYDRKVKELTANLEQRKAAVLEKIMGDKKIYDQLIADKIQVIINKFTAHKEVIFAQILPELHLPFIKSPETKPSKKVKK